MCKSSTLCCCAGGKSIRYLPTWAPCQCVGIVSKNTDPTRYSSLGPRVIIINDKCEKVASVIFDLLNLGRCCNLHVMIIVYYAWLFMVST